jgi:hypothetical protein
MANYNFEEMGIYQLAREQSNHIWHLIQKNNNLVKIIN